MIDAVQEQGGYRHTMVIRDKTQGLSAQSWSQYVIDPRSNSLIIAYINYSIFFVCLALFIHALVFQLIQKCQQVSFQNKKQCLE